MAEKFNVFTNHGSDGNLVKSLQTSAKLGPFSPE